MTRIALASAALLLAMGSAFAGSDHYGDTNANQSTVGVDSAYTASVRKHEVAKPAPRSIARSRRERAPPRIGRARPRTIGAIDPLLRKYQRRRAKLAAFAH